MFKANVRLDAKAVNKLFPDLASSDYIYYYEMVRKMPFSDKITLDASALVMHNHVEGHEAITDKKNLLKNLHAFYTQKGANPFDFVPETYHIKN
jgi:hypothetical protein